MVYIIKSIIKNVKISEFEERILITDEEYSRTLKKEWRCRQQYHNLVDNGVLIGGFTTVLNLLRNKFNYDRITSSNKSSNK